MKSIATDRFWRLFRSLPQKVRKEAQEAFRLFRDNPSHSGLRFKRLRCNPDYWSVRVTRDYRAVGRKHDDTMVWFWIGSHSEFDIRFRA